MLFTKSSLNSEYLDYSLFIVSYIIYIEYAKENFVENKTKRDFKAI